MSQVDAGIPLLAVKANCPVATEAAVPAKDWIGTTPEPPTAVQPGHHGSNRGTHNVGNFLVAQPFDISQPHSLAIGT